MNDTIQVTDHMTAHITNQSDDDFAKNQVNLQINLKLPAELFGNVDNLHEPLTPLFEAAEHAANEAWSRVIGAPNQHPDTPDTTTV